MDSFTLWPLLSFTNFSKILRTCNTFSVSVNNVDLKRKKGKKEIGARKGEYEFAELQRRSLQRRIIEFRQFARSILPPFLVAASFCEKVWRNRREEKTPFSESSLSRFRKSRCSRRKGCIYASLTPASLDRQFEKIARRIFIFFKLALLTVTSSEWPEPVKM